MTNWKNQSTKCIDSRVELLRNLNKKNKIYFCCAVSNSYIILSKDYAIKKGAEGAK